MFLKIVTLAEGVSVGLFLAKNVSGSYFHMLTVVLYRNISKSWNTLKLSKKLNSMNFQCSRVSK